MALLSLIRILSRILGTRAIRVDWVHPDELNGVLERYVLFASDTFIYEIGNEVYNSTDSFTYYNLNDLAPGTTYFIRLSVSVLNQWWLIYIARHGLGYRLTAHLHFQRRTRVRTRIRIPVLHRNRE